MASLALTPSLVPRPPAFQGFLAGLWFMAGFQLGFALRAGGRVVVRLAQRRNGGTPGTPGTQKQRSPGGPRFVPPAIALALAAYVAGYGALVVSWQNDVRRLVDMPAVAGAGHGAFIVALLATMTALYAIGRAISALQRIAAQAVLRRGASLRIGRWLSRATGAAAVAVLLAGLTAAALATVDVVYADRDAGTPAGTMQPAWAGRSGSSESAAAWDGLGRQGRAFTGGGPGAAAIAALTGTPAVEPIRVYAGLAQGADAKLRAELVVGELERTGAFDREVLLLATPTGSGWLEPQAIASLEYLYGGNTATASMQYSYHPSWVPFLFASDLARTSSQALFEAVHARWQALPVDSRPRLAVYGLSLGAQGMSGVFTDLDDLVARTDAALFTGPPSNSQPWRTLQQGRDVPSPVWQPVHQQGRQVRWQSKPGDFQALGGDWTEPRIGYLQHATDPITWLDAAVIFRRPEWLSGPAADGGRGQDVSDSMKWIPGVTFAHLATDMLVSEAVPPSHGHNFGDVALDAWAQVLPGHGRTPAQLASIQSRIEQIDTQNPVWE